MTTSPAESTSALHSILKSGVIIASDTPEYNKISSLFCATDATSNPSLVLAAVSKPEYAHLVDNAIVFAFGQLQGSGDLDVEAKVQVALDYLLVQVGVEILKRVPGRVSVSVDPRLGYDYDVIISKARNLVHIFRTEFQVPSSRVLIKIPATYPGILAAQALESGAASENGDPEPIHTNMTLVFGTVQSLACAQAGVSVISPFIGRVKDWWLKHEKELQSQSQPASLPFPVPVSDLPVSLHPGITLVRDIRKEYQRSGYEQKTKVMAAGFRSVDEIVEVCKGGPKFGPDFVTLPPDLLEGLRLKEGSDEEKPDNVEETTEAMDQNQRSHEDAVFIPPLAATSPSRNRMLVTDPTKPASFPCVTTTGVDAAMDVHAASYFRALSQERVAYDKVSEGLLKFSADAVILEKRVKDKIMERLNQNSVRDDSRKDEVKSDERESEDNDQESRGLGCRSGDCDFGS